MHNGHIAIAQNVEVTKMGKPDMSNPREVLLHARNHLASLYDEMSDEEKAKARELAEELLSNGYPDEPIAQNIAELEDHQVAFFRMMAVYVSGGDLKEHFY